jgi:hypothetical protein
MTDITPTVLAPCAHVERDTSEEDAQIVSAAPSTASAAETTEAATLAEAVFWNNTPQNISIGLAVLNKDQLHISVHRTCDLPKNMAPEMAPGLVMIKPDEGMLFKLPKNSVIEVQSDLTAPAS